MNKKKVMKILVVIAVLLIPIMYSFFYLKSYWDPYGHLEGLKIAMVNLDEGEDGENQGQKFVDALIEKDVVTICEVSSDEAERGLREGDYFATITIPAQFTHYLNSASTNDKQIATITYSPNQKTNYLASQIIGKVVTAAELSLEENVSEKVVDTLAEKLESVPESLDDILDGADQIHDGATDLSDGLRKINDGVGTLQNSYTELDTGINSAYTGSQTLNSGIGQVNSGVSTLSNGADSLDSAITQINDGANTLATQADAGINQLTAGIDQLNGGAAQVAAGTTALVAGTSADSQLGAGASQVATGAAQVAAGTTALVSGTAANSQLATGAATVSNGLAQYTATVNGLVAQLAAAGVVDEATKTVIEQNGAALAAGASAVSSGITTLNTQAQTLNAGANQVSAGASAVSSGITTLNTQAQTLNAGANQVSAGAAQLAGTETKQSLSKLTSGVATLQDALGKVKTGTTTLKSGVTTLSNGTNQLQTGSSSLTDGVGKLSEGSGKVSSALNTLKSGTQDAYDGVQTFKDEVGDGLNEANEELTKLDGLSEFVKNPIEFEEVDYGEVSSYGIAFTPLFICVGLWVGILMAYVNLYYDQQKRFKIFGNHSEYKIIRSIAYLGIALVQGFVTAYLLKIGLNMQIENNLLYYGSVALVACTFLCIIQFLIVNFGEAGKMIGLLLLVLQLASSGGTFPVQIIDEGFQKISPYMPMTYCINLLKESLIMEDTGFVAKNVKVIMLYAIVCFALTVIFDFIRLRKRKKSEDTVKEEKVESAE